MARSTTKVWLIDPVKQNVSEMASNNIPSLVSETVGEDAECYRLDTHNNVCWLSDTDTNSRYAYFFEGMDYPFDVKRYSKAIVISLGPNYWSLETILDYLRFFDKENIYADI